MTNIILTLLFLAISGYTGYRIGRKTNQDKEYWRGRGEGWQACEGMVMERALESGLKDKDGVVMKRDDIWEALVQ